MSDTTSLLTGVHHVTAMASDPRENLSFYTATLGHRLVKTTVNFDDPHTYHLYYGDRSGSPGSLLTHFPHPLSKRGRRGAPEIRETLMTVPRGGLDYWAARLEEHGVAHHMETVLGEDRLRFNDPDGMELTLLESTRSIERDAVVAPDIAAEFAVTGIEGAVLHVPDVQTTVRFLADVLGFESSEGDDTRRQVRLPGVACGDRLELVEEGRGAVSIMGAGTVHHIAWRVPDLDAQAEVAARLGEVGVGVTPVMDRQYFRSIYFRIPGGVIFEVATDGPGFDVDESVETLGAELKLPPQYEPRRQEIEAHLPSLSKD
jgi:glyoxalase family protein